MHWVQRDLKLPLRNIFPHNLVFLFQFISSLALIWTQHKLASDHVLSLYNRSTINWNTYLYLVSSGTIHTSAYVMVHVDLVWSDNNTCNLVYVRVTLIVCPWHNSYTQIIYLFCVFFKMDITVWISSNVVLYATISLIETCHFDCCIFLSKFEIVIHHTHV